MAEDDAAIADMYRVRLEMEDWEVEVAADGEKAVATAIAHPPSLLLLDIQMPKLNGIEVLRRLRGNPRTARLPVVVVSNSAGGDEVEETRRLGISAWAVKSRTTPDELIKLVRLYI